MDTQRFFVLTVLFEKLTDGKWTAECKELGTASFGDTLEETQESIEELIQLHLEGLAEEKEIDKFFSENNITVFSKPVPNIFPVQIPFALNQKKQNVFIHPSVHNYSFAGV